MAADRVGGSRRSERGETLVESLVALTVLTLVAAASFVGLRTALGSSSQHVQSAVAETLLRSAAERLQDPSTPYVARAGCGGGAYTDLPGRPGYVLTVSSVQFWQVPPTGATSTTLPSTIGFTSSCPATSSDDPGLQRIVLSITDTGSGFRQQLEVLKRAT